MVASRELVRIQEVVKRFGQTVAADHVNLTIQEGEFFALLGPSGCGKTTLLRMLAGFETPDAGQILLDGVDLVGVRAWKRPVNMMFQSYALFPHMSVYDNIAYGLRQEKIARHEIDRRVREVLEMVGLAALAKRRPGTLSGGQQQRVALARAIVKQPRVLLLDEPLAALDRKLRVEMRLELKRLQHEVGIAFVFVTHDQEEALTMADRAAVMNFGKILQVGTPEELYETPATLFVANFIGESNVFTGVLALQGEQASLQGSQATWVVSAAGVRRAGLQHADRAAIVVRPEHIQLRPLQEGPLETNRMNAQAGRIIEVAYLGSMRHFLIDLDDGTRVMAQTQVGGPSDALASGDQVYVGWEIGRGVLVPADGEGLDAGGELAPSSTETG